MSKFKVLEPGHRMEVNGIPVELDQFDWQCNMPPVGYLWARRLGNISTYPDKLPDGKPHPLAYIEGKREVVGAVHIVTKDVINVTTAEQFIHPNVQNLLILEILYDRFVHVPWYKRFFAFIMRKKIEKHALPYQDLENK